MNAKQALKTATKKIEELEDYNRRASADIKAYNKVIDSMIAGGSPCDWCEDRNECQLQAKADGKGCSEWWLAFDRPDIPEGEEAPNDSERIFSAGPVC